MQYPDAREQPFIIKDRVFFFRTVHYENQSHSVNSDPGIGFVEGVVLVGELLPDGPSSGDNA
ncbi:MAG: hypothetical protein CSA33_01495 [Desulfobulbus propionicus]|nr:MAG: hypothetical protein CSA33_01495 [Desulfobulbus propionicus]